MRLRQSDVFRRSDTCQSDPIRCLYVGNLGGLKRVHDVIQAVRLLMARTNRKVRLSLVGPGDPTPLRAFAISEGIGEVCDFKGYEPNGPDLFRHYAKRTFFCSHRKPRAFRVSCTRP